MGFRGEALASIAAVSRFEVVTRRAQDEAATRLRVDGGILRAVEQAGAPAGTRVTANRLYFNTPVRAKFLKGITTELSHSLDIVQRHALVNAGVAFQLFHNERPLLDIPEHTSLRERVALIWGLNFAKDMIDLEGEQAGFKLGGVIALPGLTRAQRSHQFFFMNRRPVVNRSLQYGFEDGYKGLLTIGRHPVGVVLLETHPRFVDVNIHPTKREIRFRDERAARDAVRDVTRAQLAALERIPALVSAPPRASAAEKEGPSSVEALARPANANANAAAGAVLDAGAALKSFAGHEENAEAPEQTEIPGVEPAAAEEAVQQVIPEPLYQPVGALEEAPLQIFDTYLLVPGDDRLLIIDQHALHERLNFDGLVAELEDHTYEAQQLTVPIVVEVAPSQVQLVERNAALFSELGIELEPFGGSSFQVTAICHLYEEAKVDDLVYRILDELGQGDLFDRENFMQEILRLATRACKASIRGGDRLTPRERLSLLEGFRRLRPPYTCPHGRPIITELTLRQMEKSFRRTQ